MPFLGNLLFDRELEPPKGFRPLSTTQAMMEYVAPIMAYVEDGTVADPNDALQVGLLLWNSTLPEVPRSWPLFVNETICPNQSQRQESTP